MRSHTIYRTFTTRQRRFVRITDDVQAAVNESAVQEGIRAAPSVALGEIGHVTRHVGVRRGVASPLWGMGEMASQGGASVTPTFVSAPAGTLSLSLLSGFELRLDGLPVRVPLSAQRVVAFLGLNPYRLARIFVAGHLWMDASEERAAAALRTALWRLGPRNGVLVRSEGQSMYLNPDVEVDVVCASRIARGLLDGAEVPVAHSTFADLRDAGELLPDWYDDWS